ncbi:MAG: lipocalin-like domain-containing protein [Rubrivivax sp.]
MRPLRRALLLALAAPAWARGEARPPAREIQPGRRLEFPRDHGAHPATRIEWWYLTGWLRTAPGDAGLTGFQVTFFRARTGLAQDTPGRLAPRQLLFAHAAVSEIGAGRHHHAQRLGRWNGELPPERGDGASTSRRAVSLGGWRLEEGLAVVRSTGLQLELSAEATQPLLLQGDQGYSRKGPQPNQASLYVTEPQLAVRGRIGLGQRVLEGQGRGWLDHEWSDELLHPQAVGWDWVGLNLDDGSALTAFRLRRADGSVLWAGGSWRAPGGPMRDFAPGDVTFEPGRSWSSPATQARYPVEWTVRTPAGTHRVRTLLDGQEMDTRRTTGSAYWEGLCEVIGETGRRVGLGYLEMTGYAGRLRL